MDDLISAFRWFLHSTLGGSVAILVALAAIVLFRRRLSVRLRHVIWLVVLARLLLPALPSSPFSLLQVTQVDFGQIITSFSNFCNSDEERPEAGQEQTFVAVIGADTPIEESGPLPDPLPYILSQETDMEQNGLIITIIAWVWAVGIAALLSIMLVHAIRIKKKFKSLQPLATPLVMDVLDDCVTQLRIKGQIKLYTGELAAAGPCIFGWFRPKIFIPEILCKELNASQLKHVLMHELAHFKRHDVLWNLLGGIAIAIHWMNPLAWLAVKQMKADREMACDACVLDALGEREALMYGMTIVEVLKQFTSARSKPQAIGFFGAGARKQLERRLYMIKGFKNGSYKLTIASVLIVLAVGAAALTNAAAPVEFTEENQTLIGSDISFGNVELFESSGGTRIYNNLERAVKFAAFNFKVPGAWPDDYAFESARVSGLKGDADNPRRVEMSFGAKMLGQWEFSAEYGGNGIDQAIANFVEDQERVAERQEKSLLVSPQTVKIGGIEAVKATAIRGDLHITVYIWQNDGVQYQMGPFYENDQLAENLIASLQPVELSLNDRYINDNLLNAKIYDADDLRYGSERAGFTPKLPLNVLDRFFATTASYTTFLNFGFPDNKEIQQAQILSVGYSLKKEDLIDNEAQKDATILNEVKSFKLLQVKNSTIFEEIKKTGFASFRQIDRAKFTAAATPLILAGQEVYRTEAYKIDGELSSPDEPDFFSYYWQEDDVCFQVQFKGNSESEMNDIVSELVVQKGIEL